MLQVLTQLMKCFYCIEKENIFMKRCQGKRTVHCQLTKTSRVVFIQKIKGWQHKTKLTESNVNTRRGRHHYYSRTHRAHRVFQLYNRLQNHTGKCTKDSHNGCNLIVLNNPADKQKTAYIWVLRDKAVPSYWQNRALKIETAQRLEVRNKGGGKKAYI